MNETTEKFLTVMLEGYNNNIQGITQYIENTESQLNEAKEQRDEMVANVAELEELLGVTADEDTDEEAETDDADEEAETEEAVLTE